MTEFNVVSSTFSGGLFRYRSRVPRGSVSNSPRPAISNDMEALLCARNLTPVGRGVGRSRERQKEEEKASFTLTVSLGQAVTMLRHRFRKERPEAI